MVAHSNWFKLMKHRIGPGCICSDSKSSSSPPDDCVPFSVSTMWAGRGSLCSVPRHTQGQGDGSAECFVMKQEPLVRARRGRSDNKQETAQMERMDPTGSHSFNSRNFSLPKKQERSQQRWLSQWSGSRAARNTVNVQKRLLGLAGWGWAVAPVIQPEHFIAWVTKSPGCNLSVAVDADRQNIIHSLTHSTTLKCYLYVPNAPTTDRWGFMSERLKTQPRGAPNLTGKAINTARGNPP